MISKDYKQNRKQVLGLYEEFRKACEEAGKSVSSNIESQARTIKDEVFNLMILGEAKSGKSTFINAYLGKEVVPMDVRQCTSAIIKIKRGNEFKLVAKSAAGGETTISGYEKIREFLKKHAAISDKYRNIPITTINNEMQGITLIDSPGVGAGGNVGMIAENYIKNANAIIFVKYLKGQAIESTTFMNFLRNNCTNRKKESLFLVLNGKSDLQGSEFVSLMDQAVQMYGKDIRREKIIGVDSKVQLFLNKCRELGTEEKIDAFFDNLDEAGEDFSPASKCWLKSTTKGGMPVFEEKMEEMSNFRSVHAAIEKFAHVANYVQLIEFLENLEKEYLRYQGMYSSVLSEAKGDVDDPKALADRIEGKKKEILDVYNKINGEIAKIYRKYTDNISDKGLIIEEAEAKRKVYREKLENFKNLPEGAINDATFSSMKKMTFDAIDEMKEFRREMADRVIDECNQKLIQYTNDSSQIPAKVYIPNFTNSDFSAIDNKARAKTSGYEDVESGLTFKTVEKVPYHHLKEHVQLVANSISNRLENEIIPKIKDNIMDYVKNCTETYKTQLTIHKNELEEEYQRLLEDQEKNNNIRENIKELERKLQVVEKGISSVVSIKEELKNYVEE